MYIRKVTRADALRAHMCAEDIEENTGTTVLTMANGRFKWKQTADHPIFNPFGEGIYYVFDGGVKFASATNAPEYDVLSWSFDGKALHFKVIEVVPDDSTHCHLYAARAGWESHPWKKTG